MIDKIDCLPKLGSWSFEKMSNKLNQSFLVNMCAHIFVYKKLRSGAGMQFLRLDHFATKNFLRVFLMRELKRSLRFVKRAPKFLNKISKQVDNIFHLKIVPPWYCP